MLSGLGWKAATVALAGAGASVPPGEWFTAGTRESEAELQPSFGPSLQAAYLYRFGAKPPSATF